MRAGSVAKVRPPGTPCDVDPGGSAWGGYCWWCCPYCGCCWGYVVGFPYCPYGCCCCGGCTVIRSVSLRDADLNGHNPGNSAGQAAGHIVPGAAAAGRVVSGAAAAGTSVPGVAAAGHIVPGAAAAGHMGPVAAAAGHIVSGAAAAGNTALVLRAAAGCMAAAVQLEAAGAELQRVAGSLAEAAETQVFETQRICLQAAGYESIRRHLAQKTGASTYAHEVLVVQVLLEILGIFWVANRFVVNSARWVGESALYL